MQFRISFFSIKQELNPVLSKKYKQLCLFLCFCCCLWSLKAQQYADARSKQLALRLDSMAVSIPHLNDTSRTNFIDVTLPEFVRALGKAHQLNLSIDNDRKEVINNAFYGEKVKNILLYLCWKYKLTIEPVGSIINLLPYNEPTKPAPPSPPAKEPIVTLKDSLLSFDCSPSLVFSTNEEQYQSLCRKTIFFLGTNLRF